MHSRGCHDPAVEADDIRAFARCDWNAVAESKASFRADRKRTMTAGPGLEELFLSRAVPVPIGHIVVPVIRPEDLVVTKILAGREKDLEDVRSVLRERQDMLDVALIRTTLTSLEEALGQSDLLPAFERLLADLETRRR